MNPVQLERVRDQLTRLRLLKSRERLEALLQEAATKDLSYADFLDQVLGEEVASNRQKHHQAHQSRPLPIREESGGLRLRLPTIAGQKPVPTGGLLPLYRAR